MHRTVCLTLIAFFALSGTSLAQETVGPWTIEAAPASATVAIGSIDSNLWLDVVDAAATVFDAFTGFSIIDDGFSNLDEDTGIELTFSRPIRNGAGAELVLFEARFGAGGSYAISTDFDGFGTEMNVLGFVDSGVDRAYFHGASPGGPFVADVFGVEIDLSDLGLALNDTVTTLRVRTRIPGTDPLGLGSLSTLIPVELQTFAIE